MVFPALHWIPSAIAAILTILLVTVKSRRYHKYLGLGMVLFALIGLGGYISARDFDIEWSVHSLHLLTGAISLVLALSTFVYRAAAKKPVFHCNLGYAAALFALISLVIGAMILLGLA